MSLHLTFIIFTLDHTMLRDYFNHFAQTSDEAKSYFAACQAELVNEEVLTSPTFKKKEKKGKKKKKLWRDCVMSVLRVQCPILSSRVINSSTLGS